MKVANHSPTRAGFFFTSSRLVNTSCYVTRTLFPTRKSYTRYIRHHQNAASVLSPGHAVDLFRQRSPFVGIVRNQGIGLYRDVWIAAIASSRKSLATQTAAICVRFHGRRVRHVYVTMQITFLARKSALIYRRGLRQRVASLTIDCNGVFAIRAYWVGFVDVLSVNAGERRSPSERSNPAFRVCIN